MSRDAEFNDEPGLMEGCDPVLLAATVIFVLALVAYGLIALLGML